MCGKYQRREQSLGPRRCRRPACMTGSPGHMNAVVSVLAIDSQRDTRFCHPILERFEGAGPPSAGGTAAANSRPGGPRVARPMPSLSVRARVLNFSS